MSQTHKDAGNEAFRNGNFEKAIEHFTAGIAEDARNHVLFSNRSACHASLKQWKDALCDAEECIRLKPEGWPKAYARLAAAQHGMGDIDQALATYEKCLEMDPTNESIKSSIDDIKASQEKKSEGNLFGSLFGPNTFAKIQTNPKLAPYLSDPDYVQKINQMIANPQQCLTMMGDQRIMQTMTELLGINATFTQPTEQQHAEQKPKAEPPKPAPTPVKKEEVVKEPSIIAKETGNKHYKNKEFDEALKCYDESIALDPSNGSVYLNRTSVLFEQGKMDECLKELDDLLCKYESKEINAPDFVLLAKILTRKGQVMQKDGKYDAAIELFQSALRENRNADTLKKLNLCEKEKKAAEAASYINPELGAEAKSRGNEFYKTNKYPEAIKEYTEAIKRNPQEHTTYSNRAAAYMKLGAYDDAVKDCEKSLEIEPTFVKAVVRLANCYYWRKEYHKAIQEYERGMKIEPWRHPVIF